MGGLHYMKCEQIGHKKLNNYIYEISNKNKNVNRQITNESRNKSVNDSVFFISADNLWCLFGKIGEKYQYLSIFKKYNISENSLTANNTNWWKFPLMNLIYIYIYIYIR